jgi:hypothetical protein
MNERIIKSKGHWHLVWHPTLDGRHSFTIERITNRKELYDGITLEKALQRFDEVVLDHFGDKE